MSAAATVVVSSAEGAGDMPSPVPAAGGDSSQDDAQPFSEVLSLSSPDHPGSSDSAPPPEPSQSFDEAHDESGTAADDRPGGGCGADARRPSGAGATAGWPCRAR